MNNKRIEELIDNFSSQKVLVIGDIMLDEYVWGKVERISPEAPVPVVEVTSRTSVPGGATNVVNNLASLGCTPMMAGVIGEDGPGSELLSILKARDIDISGIVTDKLRPTTLKTRIIAHNQQIARTDLEKRDKISEMVVEDIMRYVRKVAGSINGAIISDYGKGVVNTRLMQELIPYLREKGIFVAVDPKTPNVELYKGVSLISPNNKEAGEALGTKITDMESLTHTGKTLLSRLNAEAILITRGEEGMSLFTGEAEKVSATHIPTRARKVYDVTGAGDTVIAVFTLAVAAGATLNEAADVANHAAGIVVGEVGTATVTSPVLKKIMLEDQK